NGNIKSNLSFFERTHWSLFKGLEYLENKSLNLGTSDKELIQDEFKSQVHSLMNHQSISKSAQKKATRLFNEVDQLFESEEVVTFFKRMDTKAIEESKKQLLAVKKSLFDTEVQITVEDYKIQTVSSSNLTTLGAENSGEASKRKREEDDHMTVLSWDIFGTWPGTLGLN
ncbi:9040_t:CDS:2, partial [Funneliformis geosporum]